MKTICEYSLLPQTVQQFLMPTNAKVLSVDEKDNRIFIWAEVDSEDSGSYRSFRVYGTGHPHLNENQRFIGTVKLDNGALVFHVYEVVYEVAP